MPGSRRSVREIENIQRDLPTGVTAEIAFDATKYINNAIAEVQHTLPGGGFGGLVVKPWGERKRSIFPIQEEVFGKTSKVTGIRAPMFLPAALPSAGTFPVELVIASTANHDELVRFADELVKEAAKSGLFAFPPLTDVRIDQAKTEIVIDRDKVASMGLSMQQVGADLSAMLSGSFVRKVASSCRRSRSRWCSSSWCWRRSSTRFATRL